jgi:hypothetical protein
MKPNHPALSALIKLHAYIGGQIFENRKKEEALADDMRHVEAVIKMLSPGFNVSGIAIRRRYKGNAWFKRGTLFRHAVDVMRKADTPMTAREITERMLAARKVTDATPKEIRDLAGGVITSLRNHDGKTVEPVGEGMPVRWRLRQLF